MKKLLLGIILLFLMNGLSAQITWVGNEYTTLETQYLGDPVLFEIQSYPSASNQGAQVYIDWGNDGYGGTFNVDYFSLAYIEAVGSNSKWNNYVTMRYVGTHNRKYLVYWTGNSDYVTGNFGTFVVSSLGNPTSQTATSVSSSSINLGWAKWNSKNVMIVRKLTSASWTEPTQGTAYMVGNSIGSGTVVYNSNGASFTDNSLLPATGYDYKFYSENYSYYSAGATATATTATTSANDYFRSRVTGNWSDAATWESSPNNTNWVTAALAPGSSATAITILNGHNITLDGNITVASLTINTGGTFTASDATPRTLSIAKSASGSSTTLSNSGTWANGVGGSTVVFSGAPSSGDAIHAISGTIAFQNITINKTGGSSNVGASFGANSSVSGTLEIGTGGFVSTAPPTGFYGTNAILKFNQGASATYDVNAGDYTWSTTVVPNYITISSGTVNLNAARTATGNLLIDGGTLALNAGLTIQGNWTRSSGTFTPNSQTVTLSGATNTIINTVTDATLYDLVVSKTGTAYVTLDNNLTVSHDLTINSSAILRVPAGIGLTVAGILTNNAAEGIVLQSPENHGAPGSLITNGSIAGSGTVKAERYIEAWTLPTNGWHLISSPVNNPSIASNTNLTPGTNDDFYAWDEVNYIWLNQKVGANDITNMSNGIGYLVAYQTDATKYITGIPNNAAVSFSNLTKTAGMGDGWHLVGNPFPSAILWNKTGAGFNLTGIAGLAKMMSNTGGFSDIDPNEIIPAMQGFFVQAESTTNSFTIPLAARTHDNTVNWNKSGENNRFLLIANDLESSMLQESVIGVNELATQGYDYQFDSRFWAWYAPQFYSKAGDELLSTNTLPSLPAETIIPFGFVKNEASNFSIVLQEQLDGYIVYLTDIQTGQEYNLTDNGAYNFTASSDDDTDRFLLHFAPVSVEKPTAVDVCGIYAFEDYIYLSNAPAQSGISILNLTGQVVLRGSANGNGLTTIHAGSLPEGIYIVSVITGNQTVCKKVSIR